MKLFSLKRKELLAGNTLLLTLQPKREADKLRFWPGQYAAIGFKRDGRSTPMRCFSIVSSPGNPNELQFAMKVEGSFTQTIADLEPGEEVFVKGPFGDFVIDPDIDRRVILMAGGIGITPFMSILRYAAETQLDIPITLLYSCKTQDDIPFFNELLKLERQNPKLKVALFITNGDVDKLNSARVVRGRLNEALLQRVTSGQFNHFTYFVCGPKSFMKSMELTLLQNSVDPERVISEAFSQLSRAQVSKLWPSLSLSRLTYALTGLALFIGTCLIMAFDLFRTVPKLAAAQSPTASTTTPTTSQQSNSSAITPNDSGATTPGNSSSSSSSTLSQNQPVQSYQAPMTSVS